MKSLIGILCIFAAGLDFAFPALPENDHGRLCLALAGFSEARDQGDIGLAAVMRVVINRATDPAARWPNSICGVVQQPGQFAGVEKWKYPRRPEIDDLASWQRALEMADKVIAGTGPALGNCATATSFDRGGASGLVPACQLGAHVFYTEAARMASK